MQLHSTAQIHRHAPKHMSKHQRPRVQLQEVESGRPVSLMSESFRVKLAALNDSVVAIFHRMQIDVLQKLFAAVYIHASAYQANQSKSSFWDRHLTARANFSQQPHAVQMSWCLLVHHIIVQEHVCHPSNEDSGCYMSGTYTTV